MYEFCRVMFRVNWSAFLAQYLVQKHAESLKDVYPLAAETVIKSTYMDDSMTSVIDVKSGIELHHQLTELWEKAGMHARKWMSNSMEVLSHIPEEDGLSHVNLEEGYLPTIKTLGIKWSASEDVFQFNCTSVQEPYVVTKRSLLKKRCGWLEQIGMNLFRRK